LILNDFARGDFSIEMGEGKDLLAVATPLDNFPPSYEEALASSFADHFEQPVLIDLTSIPEDTIVYPFDLLLQNQSFSRASFEAYSWGIQTFDPTLDRNPEAVWSFFLQHLEKPKIMVNIVGTHTEYVHHHHHNEEHRMNNTESESVTDFNFRLDLSDYLKDSWIKIASEPRPNKTQLTIQESIAEYTLSMNSWKEYSKINQNSLEKASYMGI
jgi:hypothetical protein